MKTQNIYLTTLSLLAFLVLFGCDKDDEPSVKDKIVGEWTIESASAAITVKGMTLKQFYIDVAGLSEAEAQEYVDLFNQSIEDHWSGTMEFKSDGTYDFMLDGGTTAETGDWVMHPKNDQAISISYASGVYTTFNIATLTDTDFVINFEQLSRFDVDGDKYRDDVLYEFEISMTK